ncbi:DUF748 domain-containing protein [Candidimonas nitroreducens]|uniref:DUF748 domain-containing protein n=1 Tax=Candidimonas nitroreducens TaxID=683354 RepID=UPI001E390199|nr:DUF748 domain-containing protein [Candidimonas nitroreducens]
MPVLKFSRRLVKIVAGIVLALLILAGLAAWGVPKLTHKLLTHNVAELLGRQVDVGEIHFNPFTLALRAQDISIRQPQASSAQPASSTTSTQPATSSVQSAKQPQSSSAQPAPAPRGAVSSATPHEQSATQSEPSSAQAASSPKQAATAPLLQIGEIDVRVAWRSLVMFAPVIDRLHIERPRLAMVRTDATHFNFSDIVDRLARMSADQPEKPEQASDKPPRFSLNNLTLANGSVSLDDRVTGHHQEVDDLSLGIPFISSFGYATHIDVLPAVHMRINGSPFDLTGTARPFDTVPASTLDVTLHGLALDKWADFWPMPLPVKVKSALLDSKLQVVFEQPAGAAPRIRIQGSLGLRKLDVAEASGAPLLAWDSLDAENIAADLGAHTLSVGTVTLKKPQVEVHRDAKQLNWQRVAQGFAKLGGHTPAAAGAKPKPGAAPRPAAAAAGSPPTAAADPAAANRPSADPATAASSTASAASASGPVSADSTTNASKPAAAGTAGSKPPSAPARPAPAGATPPDWKVTVDTFKLDGGQAHVRDEPLGVDYPVDGLRVEVAHIALPQAANQPMQVQVGIDNSHDGSSLRAEAPVILQPLSAHAQIQLNNLALMPFAAALRHFAPIALQDGRLSIAGKVDVAASHVEARDVKLGLQKLAARDESVKPAVGLSIGSLELQADRLALDAKPTGFTLKADGIQKHGTLALKGSLTTQPLSLKTSVDLANFDAASLAPYIASSLNATIRSVSLGAKGNAEFAPAQGGKPMQADWRGAFQVNHLDLLDRVNKAKFLSWKQLSLKNMHVSMAGSKLGLGLGDIVLDDFYGNILLNDKARLNVMDVMVEKGKAGGSITQDTQTRRHKSAASKAAAQHGGGPDISIHSVTLKRGRMLFNDHFVRPNYRAELSSIDGTLTAVSSSKPTPAQVKVAGRVYGTAPFSVSGTVQPFARYLALNLKATAKGVDLPRFTTYSSKYVGYAIQRGKLSVDLHYQIKNRALQASNRVQLNQLTFGKQSNSPDALKLPVLLAVALLKDSSGNIDINLPVSGSLDDPQFSVGGIILKVIINTLTKAVTAPFKLLASAFGGGEDLSYIEFEPGSAALDDKDESSIATLVKALDDRPALKMDVIGRADPKADESGLRQAWLDQQLRRAKAKDTAGFGKKPNPGKITLTDADRAKYLKKVYSDTKIKNKPRNAIGFAKSLPPEQMKSMLLAAAPLGKQALNALAQARAQAVYEQITASAPNLASRVFIVAPKTDAGDDKDGGPATRVDFALH